MVMKCLRLKRFLENPSMFQVMARKVVEEFVGASTTRVELSEPTSLTVEKSQRNWVLLERILQWMKQSC